MVQDYEFRRLHWEPVRLQVISVIKVAEEILDTYVGEGGNFIDTANVYGRWNPGNQPLCERMIGKWLTQHHQRDKIVLATKGAADAIDKPHINVFQNRKSELTLRTA